MSNQKITKRSIEAITPNGKEFTLWDFLRYRVSVFA